MTNSITASNAYVQQMYQSAAAHPTRQQHAPAKASTPEDSVHLSSAAKRAMGDVDHDGDSH